MSQLNDRCKGRVLLLFPGTLGDFLCFLPAAVAVMQTGTEVVLVARSAWLSLIHHPHLHPLSLDHPEVVRLYSPRTANQGTESPHLRGVERAYSWSGATVPGFAEALAKATGAKEVQVFPFRGMHPGEHATVYYARCLGVEPAKLQRSLFRLHPPSPEHPCAALRNLPAPTLFVHAGSGSGAKNWAGFGELARRWVEQTHGAVIEIRGPAERGRVEHIQHVSLRLEDRDIREVATWLDGASLYVGNDSGVSHLAAILAARVLVLFGPTSPTTWAPRGECVQVLYRPDPCAHCGPGVFCTHRLPVAEVWRALLHPGPAA